MRDLEPVRLNPAYRHGGPDAGWYLRTVNGWQRISDTEAATKRYEDMRHFMHDPADLADLNAARRWWLDHMPDIGRLPTDDEVLARWHERSRD